MTRQRCCATLLLLLLSAATLPAQAFPGGRWGGGGMQVNERPQHAQRDRQFQQPQRNPEGNRQGQQGQQNPQRMSPDERRQLRRDLQDAGRDVYPQRRDWRR